MICSHEVEVKINAKHGVTLQDVRDAVQYPAQLLRAARLGADIDPDRGPRIVVEGTARGTRVLRAVLYPVDTSEETWRLATALWA